MRRWPTLDTTEGEQWLSKVLELAGPSQLSAREEAALRSELLDGAEVKCMTSA